LHHPCFDGDALAPLSFYRPVHVQVNNTHGWHGARKLVRTNEQEKQKLLQKAKQRQQQQQQAIKRQQQNSGGGTRVSTLSPNPSGARSGEDTKARTPTVCAQTIL